MSYVFGQVTAGGIIMREIIRVTARGIIRYKTGMSVIQRFKELQPGTNQIINRKYPENIIKRDNRLTNG